MKLYNATTSSIGVTDGSISNSGLSVTVNPAAASSLTLAATSPVTAGVADPLTITAKDPYGNTDTNYASTKSLTFSGAVPSPNSTNPTVTDNGGTANNFGVSTPIDFTAGVATTSGSSNGVMKLYNATTSSIGVTDGSISN